MRRARRGWRALRFSGRLAREREDDQDDDQEQRSRGRHDFDADCFARRATAARIPASCEPLTVTRLPSISTS